MVDFTGVIGSDVVEEAGLGADRGEPAEDEETEGDERMELSVGVLAAEAGGDITPFEIMCCCD